MIRRMFVALSLALLCSTAFAAGVEVGGKAPTFKGLPGVDGKEVSLDGLKDAKVVVVCSTCNVCPMSVAYEDRFVEFQKKYADKGVKFVAINANKSNPTETLVNMKTRAEEKGFNFPYVFDASGASAGEIPRRSPRTCSCSTAAAMSPTSARSTTRRTTRASIMWPTRSMPCWPARRLKRPRPRRLAAASATNTVRRYHSPPLRAVRSGGFFVGFIQDLASIRLTVSRRRTRPRDRRSQSPAACR